MLKQRFTTDASARPRLLNQRPSTDRCDSLTNTDSSHLLELDCAHNAMTGFCCTVSIHRHSANTSTHRLCFVLDTWPSSSPSLQNIRCYNRFGAPAHNCHQLAWARTVLSFPINARPEIFECGSRKGDRTQHNTESFIRWHVYMFPIGPKVW